MKLKEVRIFEFRGKDKELITEVYNKILYKDKYWHFLFEGKFSVIRCRNRYAKKVSRFFNKKDFNTDIIDYKEDQDITKKYLEQFIPIFHNYSVLAVTFDPDYDDFLTLFHRIVHCFLNTMSSPDLIKKYSDGNNWTWESYIMNQLAIKHAFSRGVIATEYKE